MSLDNAWLCLFAVQTHNNFSINLIASLRTPNLHEYISSLRYKPMKFRPTFDYFGDMAGPIKNCFRCP